jgi:2-oxoglutarate/2-oxoacid ferredoxin oxidoreductase subunit beta
MNIADYDTGHSCTWCPGCGDFGIWVSLKNALATLGFGHDDAFIVYGVGCHGNMASWMRTYGFAGLHGRTLPVAQGVKLANHKLPVIVVSGDGDGLGEGGNHFLHASRRNPDITVILHDNQVYGLTTGQAAPTARPGLKTKSTPIGVTDEPLSPVVTAIASGATFVARGFAGDAKNLAELMVKGINHKGFSVIDVLQPCVTFNKPYTYSWYREHTYQLPPEYKPDNKLNAIEKGMEWGDKIPLGVIYEEHRPAHHERFAAVVEKPLVEVPIGIADFDKLIEEFV